MKSKEIKIEWLNRYSDTMENDKQGRWARVAVAGNFATALPFIDGRPARWDIAWVKKIVFDNSTVFEISYYFPSNGKHVLGKLDEAIKEVEDEFRWFIKHCSN